MSTFMALHVKVFSDERIFPLSRSTETKSVPLSIIDATTTHFAACQTIIVYDGASSTLTPEHLRRSLQKTLDAYPQWCGRLHLSRYSPQSTDHTLRHGRLFLTHGSSTDPGVQFLISKADKSLSDLMPTPAERASARRWNASHFQSSQLINAPVSTTDLDNQTLPSLVVQITTFTCYGLCIGVKFAHPLSDAHCMSLFVKDWADISRAMLSVNPLPAPSPFFEPQLLDRCADGDIDASSADLALLEKAKSLPMHRYDWWISDDECPYETHTKHISPELKEIAAAGTEPSGTKIPWAEWELQKPTEHFVLHFTHEELENMKQAMVATVKGVSIHDALLAHIWSCANRARGLDSDDQPVHLDYTLGLRNRVSPPLPTRFVGSCHLIAAVSCTGREASSDPAKLASLIRNTIAVFTPDKIAAHLHSKIYEQNPNRFWEGFLGRRHMMPTSWVRTGLNTIDFGTGFARYVEAVLPPCDGLLHIMEAIPISTDTPGLPLKHWAEHGVDVHFLYGGGVDAEDLG